MKRIAHRIALGIVAATAPVAAHAATPCDKLVKLTIPQVEITSAEAVPAGGFTPPGDRQKAGALPAFCRVVAIARPSADSDINFEVWIPTTSWNGKFQGVGTGGYAGSISYAAMATALRRGYAVTSTDMGHKGDDLAFGKGHPEKVIDWAYRAIHVTAETGKLIVRNATGRFPEWSYFIGCATGGHQAMSEVQRYPDDYDGVIAGDPANNRLHETAAYVWAWKATHRPDGAPIVAATDLKLVTNAAITACDGVDGVKDGVIDDPRQCRFDVGSLLCAQGKTTSCLTTDQIAAFRAVYAGPRRPDGRQIFPGWPVGSEGYGDRASDGWGAFIVDPKVPMRSDVYNHFVFHDPDWDYRTFDFDRDLDFADATRGYIGATDRDLTPFRKRGGKLLMYTGWSDPVLPAAEVIAEYGEILEKTIGTGPNDFVRFFMVPGMGHCSGGPGPTTFDMLPALEHWVEQGEAPKMVPASRDLPGGKHRTRLLCAYPAAARWNGKGDSDDSTNFACSNGRAPARPGK
jgi:feruloyl esterase